MIEILCEPVGLVSRSDIIAIQDSLRTISQLVEQDEGCCFGLVTVVIVTTERICKLHKAFFDDPTATDVITFPGASDSSDGRIEGEIAICLEVAREQAEDAGHSANDEIVFLATHGLLHLCGWDDQDPAARTRMLDRQQELMAQAARESGSTA